MLEILVWLTAALCVTAVAQAYLKYRDPFHPALIIFPMFAFIYVVMPISQIHSGELFSLVSEDRLEWVQAIVLACGVALAIGLKAGSNAPPIRLNRPVTGYDWKVLHRGAYILGGLGLAAWAYTVHNSGGITSVFSQPKGIGWSDWGFIREAAYLMIVGILLLLSPDGFRPQSKLWRVAIAAFSIPYLMQGLLGAQRGPTFLITISVAMSWYLARFRRPSLTLMIASGTLLGFLMLFLVANRDAIYLGSQKELRTDTSGLLQATEANEYVFGAGCMITAQQEGRYFWGKRYLAQVVVRPIPKQIWPTKYQDFGVPELLQNAGVAGPGLLTVMGWSEVPGAAAAMVGDLWVEFSWLCIPVIGLIGYAYGRVWRSATASGSVWTTQYVIFVLLSVYMVSQSGEAVIFRFVILTLPVQYVWRKAEIHGPAAEPLGDVECAY